MSTTQQETDKFIEDTKKEISDTLRANLNEQGLSIRKLAHSIGMQHPQVLRITSGENYTINNLIKILDAAGLQVVVKKKD